MTPRILVAGFGEEVAAWLEEEIDGVQIMNADSLPQALDEVVDPAPPALLVLSERVGDGEGEEVARQARANSAAESTRIIFCLDSASDPALGRRLVESHQVDQLLISPLDRRELVRHSAQLLGIQPRSSRATAGDSVAAGVAALWERFRETIFARVDLLESAGAGLLQGTLSLQERREAEREAHKLAGSVGTFGFSEASRIARTCEQILGGVG